MSDILFVIKTFVITIIMVVVLQIRIGTATVEQHSQDWIRTSPLIEMFRGVADGGVKAMTQAYRSVAQIIDTNITKRVSRDTSPGSRLSSLGMKRSDTVIKQQELKAQAGGGIGAQGTVVEMQLEEAALSVGQKRRSVSATDETESQPEANSQDGFAEQASTQEPVKAGKSKQSERSSWFRSGH